MAGLCNQHCRLQTVTKGPVSKASAGWEVLTVDTGLRVGEAHEAGWPERPSPVGQEG